MTLVTAVATVVFLLVLALSGLASAVLPSVVLPSVVAVVAGPGAGAGAGAGGAVMAVLGVLIMMGEVLVKLLIGLILVTGDKIALLLVLPIAAVIIVVTTRLVAVLATSFTEV